jgi:uncharacterized membrane protein YeaQ/YmgE (transglycosylase-associated protein family)
MYLFTVVFVVFFSACFGILAPAMISAKDSTIVFLGILLCFVGAPVAGFMYFKLMIRLMAKEKK